MNKKEILEIRRQFTSENCAITRICGCYVSSEKEKHLEFKEAFLSLPEEEAFKYFDIFKKALSGTIGKNLIHMGFPLEQELAGGTQEFLQSLKESKLTDDILLEEFYDKVIEYYNFGEQYLILLVHAVYDIPGRALDGSEMFDASENVYEHILCCICPVALSKAGLCYNPAANSIQDRIRDWVVGEPANGFLFPAFNDRASDLHHLLFYSKKPEELQDCFVTSVLGCREVMSAGRQKESFQDIITNTLKEDCDYTVIRTIHENLTEMIEEAKEDPEPLELGKQEIRKLLTDSGIPEEKMETFEKDYNETIGAYGSLLASNIAETRKFSIKTPEVVINVNPERSDLVNILMLDGIKCLVIPVYDEVEVNGIPVNAK